MMLRNKGKRLLHLNVTWVKIPTLRRNSRFLLVWRYKVTQLQQKWLSRELIQHLFFLMACNSSQLKIKLRWFEGWRFVRGVAMKSWWPWLLIHSLIILCPFITFERFCKSPLWIIWGSRKLMFSPAIWVKLLCVSLSFMICDNLIKNSPHIFGVLISALRSTIEVATGDHCILTENICWCC